MRVVITYAGYPLTTLKSYFYQDNNLEDAVAMMIWHDQRHKVYSVSFNNHTLPVSEKKAIEEAEQGNQIINYLGNVNNETLLHGWEDRPLNQNKRI